MANKIWRNLIRTAAAACFVAGSGAQAAGVFYQSDFDPIGFAGSAVWNVYDNGSRDCLNSIKGVTKWIRVNTSNSDCKVALSVLSVSLWEGDDDNLSDAQANSGSNLVQADFPNENGNPNPSLVRGMYVVNGVLAGVDTLLVGPQLMSNGNEVGGLYGVQFTSGMHPLNAFDWLGNNVTAIGNLRQPGAYLWHESDSGLANLLESVHLCPKQLWPSYMCAEAVPTNVGGGQVSAEFLTYDGLVPTGFRTVRGPELEEAPIPEPGSLALLGGALVSGWITRRRKAAA